jgi:hypothetical protein
MACKRSGGRLSRLDKNAYPGHVRLGVSLYQVQELLFHVNRDRQVRARLLDERERLVPSLPPGPLAARFGITFPDCLAILRGTKP